MLCIRNKTQIKWSMKNKDVLIKELNPAAVYTPAEKLEDLLHAFTQEYKNTNLFLSNYPEQCVEKILEFYLHDHYEEGNHLLKHFAIRIKNEIAYYKEVSKSFKKLYKWDISFGLDLYSKLIHIAKTNNQFDLGQELTRDLLLMLNTYESTFSNKQMSA